jgi:hypothetical protein
VGTNRGSGRKYARNRLPDDSETYRDLIERSPSLSEEVPELDFAQSSEEQVRIYRQSNEQIVREGRA